VSADQELLGQALVEQRAVGGDLVVCRSSSRGRFFGDHTEVR
jgi:hypothetical protein